MTKSFNPTFKITNRIAAGLTRIERARGFLEAAALSEAWVYSVPGNGNKATVIKYFRFYWGEGPFRKTFLEYTLNLSLTTLQYTLKL
jgi:hypothetical protein